MGIAGSVLLILSAWVDCADGEVARLKFLASEWGAKLDIVSDNIVHCSVFFSIGMGLYFLTSNSAFKYLGMLAVLGSLTSLILLKKPYWVRR
jgi:1L-myo-inositol 1-phosphate cytidylyltransferase / CDP-L-myo-inositol myo-inositolphosphotransferase